MVNRQNNREIGSQGEELAVQYLIKHGYKILERNIHFSKNCEIDIIALDKNTLVCVEVKSRKTAIYGSPLEAITPQKFRNIRLGLFSYLEEHHYRNYRIDAISIILSTGEIDHLKNVSL